MPDGSDPNTAIDDTLDEAKRIEVSRRLKAAGHWGQTYKDFVAKLVDYLPDTEATIASLCQESDIDVADFYRLQTIPENPSQDDLFQLYTAVHGETWTQVRKNILYPLLYPIYFVLLLQILR